MSRRRGNIMVDGRLLFSGYGYRYDYERALVVQHRIV